METSNTRLILFHKHPVSANLQFLYFSYGGVCAFNSLPALSALIDDDAVADYCSSVIHPSSISSWAEQKLQLESGALQAETEFYEMVEVPNGKISIYLAGFAGYEVPHSFLSQCGARLVSLMECVGIAPVEMLLLQKAYRVIMGG